MTFKDYKKWVLSDPRSQKLKFIPDGKIHYTYRITELFGEGLHYYGSRTDDDTPTLGCGYYTSSQDIKNKFKECPEKYKIKILRFFNNRTDAILLESYLHEKFDAKNHPKFINRSNQMPWGFDCTGIKRSPETLKRMSEAQIKFNAEVASDPEKYKLRQQRQSEAHKKREQRIKSDSEKLKKRGQRMSAAAKIRNQKLKDDPDRYKQKVEKNRIASTRTQAEIAADPERSAKRHKKLSKAASKPVYEYDLDGNFIREFSSQVEATEFYKISNKSGINHCVIGRQKTCNGSIWKLEKA